MNNVNINNIINKWFSIDSFTDVINYYKYCIENDLFKNKITLIEVVKVLYHNKNKHYGLKESKYIIDLFIYFDYIKIENNKYIYNKDVLLFETSEIIKAILNYQDFKLLIRLKKIKNILDYE